MKLSAESIPLITPAGCNPPLNLIPMFGFWPPSFGAYCFHEITFFLNFCQQFVKACLQCTILPILNNMSSTRWCTNCHAAHKVEISTNDLQKIKVLI